MKLPYRAGDSFALPLGDGTSAPAEILACDHHTVDIAVAGLELRGVSDRALVLRRWRRSGRPSVGRTSCAPDLHPHRAGKPWIGPAHAERIAATHLGVANLELAPLHVRNRWKPEFSTDARYVRVAQRGGTLDPRELAGRFPQVEAFDCSGVALTSLDFPASLRALRLARIDSPVDLRELARLPLDTLHLEHLREVRGIDALVQWDSLEQLEMLGFWQLELDDVWPLLDLRNLVRADIDIGGRRKNVELYRRANWAYPWPFELCGETISEARRVEPPARSG
ncbi:MAG TPA: hypothetical protein VMV65_08985 [Alphaproteobacteria bacterium]|nr:hypothetical protein [Alphaproteobacteria bacterium]